MKKTDEHCCYCGKLVVYPLLPTKEHIIPKSQGGSNHSENKRLCCNRCNLFRGNKSFQYWKSEIEHLIKMKRVKFGMSVYDYKIMLINIDHIEQAVVTATPEMFRQKTNTNANSKTT